ncbi:hypothetical protein Leryth_022007 [Lithospermum erythrorhizon]|nr:hypothetical protein Leryth_022007 [Lithospermum erythrorhizon]
MDDMWSIEAWNELKRIIPDDKMGSRILLTSRETNAIKDVDCNIVHRMTLLSENESWDLLQKKQQICPLHLADIGKQIAKVCKRTPVDYRRGQLSLQFHVATKLWPPWRFDGSESLKFLYTLSNVTLGSFTKKILTLTPKITKLVVCETYKDFAVVGLWDDFFQNLVLLEYIQTLKMSCFGQNRPLPLPSPNAFPHSLKNLTLRQSFLPWEAMKLIGDLPNVEVLKLRNYAFQGPEWETVEGGFQRKRYV